MRVLLAAISRVPDAAQNVVFRVVRGAIFSSIPPHENGVRLFRGSRAKIAPFSRKNGNLQSKLRVTYRRRIH